MKMRAGKKRTYFFDVRPTRSDDFFITITESKRKFHEGGYERHKLFLYKEDFNDFLEALENTVDHVKTELMPDYDYGEYKNPAEVQRPPGGKSRKHKQQEQEEYEEEETATVEEAEEEEQEATAEPDKKAEEENNQEKKKEKKGKKKEKGKILQNRVRTIK
jgi:hypothetical protein